MGWRGRRCRSWRSCETGCPPGASVLENPAAAGEGAEATKAEWIAGLVRQGACDPAFAYASRQCAGFLPTLRWEQSTRSDAASFRDEWNAAVDRYIASGWDARAPYAVACATKVGLHGGPLHHRCNNAACDRVEPEGGPPFRRCAKCHKVYYCSAECQRAHWKAGHRQGCGSDTVVLLPSRVHVQELVLELVDV